MGILNLENSASASQSLAAFKSLRQYIILDDFTAINVHIGFNVLFLSTHDELDWIITVENQRLADLFL